MGQSNIFAEAPVGYNALVDVQYSTVLVPCTLYLPCPSLSHLGLSCKLKSGFLLVMNDLALCYETEATSNLENGLNCNFADSNNVKI